MGKECALTPAELANALGGAKKDGDGWWALCPAHADKNPSLHILHKRGGGTGFTCMAGCTIKATVAAVAKAVPAAYPRTISLHAKITDIYDYQDEGRVLLYQVCRKEPKTFLQRRPDGKGGWIWKLDGVRQVLFRLPEILNEKFVVVVEGEKDALALVALGIPATCNSGGAGGWQDEYSESLKGKKVAIIADADKAGRAHAQKVANSLYGMVASLRVLECPPPHNDSSDWIAARATVKDFLKAIQVAPEIESPPSAPPPDPPAIIPSGELVRLPDDDDPIPPEYSDIALAGKFTQQHGENLRYVAAWGKWFFWNGAWWEVDTILRAYDMARKVCAEQAANLAIFLKAQNLQPAAAKRIASAQVVSGIERLARAYPRHAARSDQFDADLWQLNTPAGTVDLTTGEMRPHRRTDYHTKITAVAPGGECPLFLGLVDRATGGDADLKSYLQRVAGYCLTGSTKEQALFFIYGPSQTGKSRFVEALAGVMGDYACSAPMEAFIDHKGGHPTDLAGLRGSRLVTASETEENRSWAEAKVKTLTGQDRISARFMRQDFFEFLPTFKILVAGNYRPRLKNPDGAMRRRFQIIPFDKVIPEAERDKNLHEKLEAERPGILRWMIDGCLDWQRQGLNPPQAVTGATDEYFEAEDTVGRWLEEACTIEASMTGLLRHLYGSWQKWCEVNGEFSGSNRRLGGLLDQRGFERWRDSDGSKGFQGLAAKNYQ